MTRTLGKSLEPCLSSESLCRSSGHSKAPTGKSLQHILNPALNGLYVPNTDFCISSPSLNSKPALHFGSTVTVVPPPVTASVGAEVGSDVGGAVGV